jgi:hypothetical protein
MKTRVMSLSKRVPFAAPSFIIGMLCCGGCALIDYSTPESSVGRSVFSQILHVSGFDKLFPIRATVAQTLVE